MDRPERIVFATDLSPIASRAMQAARSLAVKRQAEVHLLHSELESAAPPGGIDTALSDAANELRGAGLEVHVHRVSDPPAGAIVDLALKLNADWIVMGTHGTSSKRDLLLGSVAARTLARAHCPVLTVREIANDWDAWRLRRIVVPIDFSPVCHRAFEIAQELAAPNRGEIQLVHAYTLPFALTRTLSETILLSDRTREGSLEELERIAAPARAAGLAVSTRVERGRAVDVILEVAEQAEAGLIAMGAHTRSALPLAHLGSVTQQIVARAACPVVSLRS